MRWHRIWAIASRYLKQIPTNFNKIVSVYYWPLIDVLVVGLIGVWCKTGSGQSANTSYALISGVALWQLVIRANYSIARNLLEEIETKNIINLFSTPLTIYEWVTATIVESLVTTFTVGLYCVLLVYMLFGFNIFSLGPILIPIFLMLFAFGISIGLFTGALLIFWGLRVQVLVWTLGWLFAPLSCAYYSISVLPTAMQKFVKIFPTVHIFENIRQLVLTGTSSTQLMLNGFILTIFYFILALGIFVAMFNRSKQTGLIKLN